MRASVEFDPEKIDSIFRPLDRGHAPGATVGIALHGRPLYRRAFGLANMELPIVLAPNMRMRIGSTSKHMTSLAYLLLCEQGRASLDDRVGDYLPELHATARSVTLRQLMAHVSGLRDAHEMAWQFSGTAAISSQDLLALYQKIDTVNSEPGSAWSYNNGGYLILSAAIERITGEALEDVLTERIFRPVGMLDTLLRRRDIDLVPNSATLHATGPTGLFERASFGTALAGEGGIVSTVDDMLRWLAHMDDPRIGSAETWAMLARPYQLPNGTLTGYGLGLIVHEYRGMATVSHGGGVVGGNSQMLKVPSAGLDIVIMLNRDDVSAPRLANQVLNACIAGLPPAPQPSECPCAHGVFRSATTGRVIELFERDGQQIVSIDGYDWPFVAAAEGVLEPDPIWSYLKLRVLLYGGHQYPTSVEFEDFGHSDRLVRLEPPEERPREIPAGTYSSASAGLEAVIGVEGECITLLARSRFGSHTYALVPLASGLWRARSLRAIPWDAILSFAPDGREFHLSALRTRRLKFVRQR